MLDKSGAIKEIYGASHRGVEEQDRTAYGKWPQPEYRIERHALKPADYADMPGAPACGTDKSPQEWATFILGRD